MDNNQEIISRLKFIGKLNKGEKLNIRHMFVQPNGFITSLSRRFLYQDNRGNTLNFCHFTITRSFDLLVYYEKSNKKSDRVLFKNLLNDLRQATIGLANLKHTYLEDTKFTCDMDTLLESINSNLDKYNIQEKLISKLDVIVEDKPDNKNLEEHLNTSDY